MLYCLAVAYAAKLTDQNSAVPAELVHEREKSTELWGGWCGTCRAMAERHTDAGNRQKC